MQYVLCHSTYVNKLRIIIPSIKNNITQNPKHPNLKDSFMRSPLKIPHNPKNNAGMPINRRRILWKIKERIDSPPVLFNSCQAYSSPLSANAGIEIIVRSNNKYFFS